MGHETIYGEDGPVEPHGGVKGPFIGVEDCDVGTWYASPDGSGKPEAVLVNFNGIFVPTEGGSIEARMFMRIKTAQAVDELCRALLWSRRKCWPNEPINVY